MSVYERLELLEERWNQYEPSKKLLIFIALMGMVGYLSYELLFFDMFESIERSEGEIASLQRKIKKNNPRFLEKKILKLKKEIVSIKSEIEQLRMKKHSLESELTKKGYVFYSKKSFSHFLDRLLAFSVQKRVLIDSVVIEDIKRPFSGLLNEVKLLRIEGSGNFLPLVEYVRGLEDEMLLFKLDRFAIETNGTQIGFTLELRMLGVEG